MDRAFEAACGFTLKWEGGLNLDPNDSGNYANGVLKGTKYGISAAAYPDLDIRNLTEEQAKEIYYRDYWNVINGQSLPFPLSMAVFDFAVNSGPGTAVKTLQSLLGVTEDGIVGPVTLKAIQNQGQNVLIIGLNAKRIVLLNGLDLGSLEYGILRRVCALSLKCGTYLVDSSV